MARPLRIEYPGAFYHVINRGNAGQDIFKSKRDRERFVSYLEKMVNRFGVRLHTYCMMTNHYHLLIETPEPNLSRAIQWLNVGYALYFNTKRGRHGHLFQGRFKSILVEADEYLKQLSRYIHLNPLRVNMVESLDAYPWSSYAAFVGKEKWPDWLEINWLLKWFGKNRNEAQRQYRDFVEAIDLENIDNPADDLAGGSILGGQEFVDWVKKTFLQSRQDHHEIPALTQLKPRVSVDAVIQSVAAHCQCTPEQIIAKGKKKNLPRDIAIYITRETTGLSAVELGRRFGGIRGGAITNRYTKVNNMVSEDKRLRKKVHRIHLVTQNF